MSLAAPLALALGGLAIPIILLYMLRLRRREQLISSILFWQELARDRSANAPWQKLRRNIFLILQLLILAALVLALAQPSILSADPVDGQVFILLDASASMAANDGEGGKSRFEGAVEQINQMAGQINGNDRVTLISVADSPVVLAAGSNDQQRLATVLAGAAPELTYADWPAAFALVNGLRQGTDNPRIVILSDGALPNNLPPLAGDVRFIPVGIASDNLGISVLGSRNQAEQSEVLVGVRNYGPNAQTALLSIFLDNQLHDSRRVELGAGEEKSLSWLIPPGVASVEAAVSPADGGSDYLPVDDRAWTLLNNSEGATVKLVTDGNQFLERIFAILPNFTVTRVAAEDYAVAEDDERYDLTVYDGVPIPQNLPDGNVLIFDPQPPTTAEEGNTALIVGEVFTNTLVTRMADDSRLTDVAWRDVNVAQARRVEGVGLIPLIDAEGGALLLAGEIDERRVAVFPFDLTASDLPLRVAFPVIMANITEWLSAGASITVAGQAEPGTVVALSRYPRADSIRVRLPGGETWTRSNLGEGGPIYFDQTDQTGRYAIEYIDDSGKLIQLGQFVINFFNPSESDISTSEVIRLGASEVLSEDEEIGGMRELWAIVLGVGLLLITLEWCLAYHRGLNRLLSKAR